MKNSLARQLIFIILLLLSSILVFSQGKFEVSGGVGLPERLNFKLKYGGRFQFGAGIRKSENWDFNKMILTVDCYYHFAKSKTTDLYSWYLNGGFTYEPTYYSRGISTRTEVKSFFYFLRIGRPINFSKHMGIKLDLGFTLANEWQEQIYYGYRNTGIVTSDTKYFYLYPAGSVSYFFRF